jgi:small GTP-binding protein
MTEEMVIKVVIIGECGVGKTNLLNRFIKNEFSPDSRSTIATEFFTKTLVHQDISVRAQFWDTAGQERYRSLIPSFFAKCDGAILVYDVTNKHSFEKLKNWIDVLQNRVSKDSKLMIIGNKTDLLNSREVSTQEGKDFASSLNIFFYETSAKDNFDKNVDRAFNEIALQCVQQKVTASSERDISIRLRASNPNIQPQRESMPGKKGGKCC